MLMQLKFKINAENSRKTANFKDKKSKTKIRILKRDDKSSL